MRNWIRIVAPLLPIGCITSVVRIPANATRFEPPNVYRTWWAMTQACSGAQRPMGEVGWYRVPGGIIQLQGTVADGMFIQDAAGPHIVLASRYVDDGQLVRHEMLHALLGVNAHPRAQFLDRCAGVVSCAAECAADGGPMPPTSALAVEASSSVLAVTGRVEPATPSVQVDSGHFRFIVTARNLSDSTIEIVEPAHGVLRAEKAAFWYDLIDSLGQRDMAGEVSTDESRAVFAKRETKTQVFDFRIGNNATERQPGPGSWVFRGRYSTLYGDSVRVQINP